MQSSPGARPPASGRYPVVAGEGKWSRLSGLFGFFESKPKPSAATVEDPNADALLAFPSEGVAHRPVPVPIPIGDGDTRVASGSGRAARPRFSRPTLIAVALAVIVASGLAILAVRRLPASRLAPAQPRAGRLTIDTRLVTAEVLVDGERRGVTPLTLSLAPGAHTVTVRNGGDERVVPLTIAAGADVTQYFDMKVASPLARFGQVSVTTDPPGARVAIDGRVHGISPLTVTDLTAAQHKVTVTNEAGSAERTVLVTAGVTASMVFSLPKSAGGPVGGWLSIAAPFEVQVMENEDVIGTSGASRIMLAAGRHSVMFTNRSLGYQESRRIDVLPGKTTAIQIEPPKAPVDVNARPWAEIMVDGRSVGETPIANLLVSVGPHELIFRHPQLGERKQTLIVTAKGPNRMAMDLTK